MARILVVDDNPELRDSLELALSIAGHEVRTAEDGDQALRILSKHPFDLTITDLFMPVREGIETILEIRRRFPSVAVIAMSGGAMGSPVFLKAAALLGAARTLQKPFTEQELLTSVAAVMPGSGPVQP